MSEHEFHWPRDGQHLVTVGQTGSGKSQGNFFVLSQAPFEHMPYIIFDTKYDDLVARLDRAQHIPVGEMPKYPGIYVSHPAPGFDDDAVNNWFDKIWRRGNTGVVIDEALDLPKAEAPFRRLLTQGRSLNIPIMVASQRPYDVSTYIFTEARHFWKFKLMRPEDNKRIDGFMPKGAGKLPLGDFKSLWYNSMQDRAYPLNPVPQAETIAEEIDARLPKRKRTI